MLYGQSSYNINGFLGDLVKEGFLSPGKGDIVLRIVVEILRLSLDSQQLSDFLEYGIAVIVPFESLNCSAQRGGPAQFFTEWVAGNAEGKATAENRDR